jgi:hypothetical protein
MARAATEILSMIRHTLHLRIQRQRAGACAYIIVNNDDIGDGIAAAGDKSTVN